MTDLDGRRKWIITGTLNGRPYQVMVLAATAAAAIQAHVYETSCMGPYDLADITAVFLYRDVKSLEGFGLPTAD